jgi:hypothetical protein
MQAYLQVSINQTYSRTLWLDFHDQDLENHAVVHDLDHVSLGQSGEIAQSLFESL